ncbi:MAG: hypothetical protein ACQEQF_02700 [Bacillota bacterium]
MRLKDSFEKFLAIEDKNYKKELNRENDRKLKQEMHNTPFI